MKLKIIPILLIFAAIISCSKEEENCECNEYLKTSNGNLALYGSAGMQLCDGTIPNPSPKLTVYIKECK